MIVYLYFLHHIVYLRAIEMRKYKKMRKKNKKDLLQENYLGNRDLT